MTVLPVTFLGRRPSLCERIGILMLGAGVFVPALKELGSKGPTALEPTLVDGS